MTVRALIVINKADCVIPYEQREEKMNKELKAGKLQVRIFENRAILGREAAEAAAGKIKQLLRKNESINIIFAAAPSQNEFLAALISQPGIDWTSINGFHMDEYVGLEDDRPQRFGNFLKNAIFGKLPFRTVHYLDGNAADLSTECQRYTQLLIEHPPHIVMMGIGENAHIAFNDPHVADFEDPAFVKVVELDEACRQQQVNDGCFTSIENVPAYALTLTIPALMKAGFIFCMVPAASKAKAVLQTLSSDVQESVPSTILRSHQHAVLFLDTDSSKLLPEFLNANIGVDS